LSDSSRKSPSTFLISSIEQTMTQLAYSGYRQDQFDDQEYPLYAKGRGSGVASLSPFDVPESIEIVITELGEAQFCFRYADVEKTCQDALVWQGAFGISAVLGLHSWRILVLQVAAAGQLKLDPRMAWLWFKDSADDVRIAAERNSEVIAKIMAAMPDAVRESVVAAAHTARVASARTIPHL
jgi:hypothetical protein